MPPLRINRPSAAILASFHYPSQRPPQLREARRLRFLPRAKPILRIESCLRPSLPIPSGVKHSPGPGAPASGIRSFPPCWLTPCKHPGTPILDECRPPCPGFRRPTVFPDGLVYRDRNPAEAPPALARRQVLKRCLLLIRQRRLPFLA